MLLVFSVLSPDDEVTPFALYSDSLEKSVELLTTIVRLKFILLSATLIESDGSEITLPIESIDGDPISTSFQLLQGEWELILQTRK